MQTLLSKEITLKISEIPAIQEHELDQLESVETMVEEVVRIMPEVHLMREFVHVNMLKNYQSSPFVDVATEVAEKIYKTRMFRSLQSFATWIKEGHITQTDFSTVLHERFTDITPEEEMFYWHFVQQPELDANTKQALREVIADQLGIPRVRDDQHYKDITSEYTQRILASYSRTGSPEARDRKKKADQAVQDFTSRTLPETFASLGEETTMSGLFEQLTGRKEISDDINGMMIKNWVNPFLMDVTGRKQSFRSWWQNMEFDFPNAVDFDLEGVADADQPFESGLVSVSIAEKAQTMLENGVSSEKLIAESLTRLGVSEEQWQIYMNRLMAQNVGWYGLVKHYEEEGLTYNIHVKDVLALNLFLEAEYTQEAAEKLFCLSEFGISRSLSIKDQLLAFFEKHPGEWVFRMTAEITPPIYPSILQGHSLRDHNDRLNNLSNLSWETKDEWREVALQTLNWPGRKFPLLPSDNLPDEFVYQELAATRMALNEHPIAGAFSQEGLLHELCCHYYQLGYTTDTALLKAIQRGDINVAKDVDLLHTIHSIKTENLLQRSSEQNLRERMEHILSVSPDQLEERLRQSHTAPIARFRCMDDRNVPEGILLEANLQEVGGMREFGTVGSFGINADNLVQRPVNLLKDLDISAFIEHAVSEGTLGKKDFKLQLKELVNEKTGTPSGWAQFKKGLGLVNFTVEELSHSPLFLQWFLIPIFLKKVPEMMSRILTPETTARIEAQFKLPQQKTAQYDLRILDKDIFELEYEQEWNYLIRKVKINQGPAAVEAYAALFELQHTIQVQLKARVVHKTLWSMGATDGKLPPLVVLQSHGGTTTNNPLNAAYECGACGKGRDGIQNANAFAQWANDPEVRALLNNKKYNVDLSGTTFVASHFDTTKNETQFFDQDTQNLDLDELQNDDIRQLLAHYKEAVKKTDQELALMKIDTLPVAPSSKYLKRKSKFLKNFGIYRTPGELAQEHTKTRAHSWSQAIPEWGHAGVAGALIGRSQILNGVDTEQRLFQIEFDPESAEAEARLRYILQNYRPVVNGIMYEYYLATVDPNGAFASKSKASWNMMGNVGAISGSGSDSKLQVGLPPQAVGRHEDVRPSFIIDGTRKLLEKVLDQEPETLLYFDNEWGTLVVREENKARNEVEFWRLAKRNQKDVNNNQEPYWVEDNPKAGSLKINTSNQRNAVAT